MDTGTKDKEEALQWAQESADGAGQPRWVCVPPQGDTYHISREKPEPTDDGAPLGVTRVDPKPKSNDDMFDKSLVSVMRPAIVESFRRHGDVLRSVGVFFDYYGGLNDAQNVNRGIWLGPEGAVTSPDGVVGSIASCLVLLQQMLERGEQLHGSLLVRLEAVSKELRNYEQQKAQLQKSEDQEQSGKKRDAGGSPRTVGD